MSALAGNGGRSWRTADGQYLVESRCGAVAVGLAYLFPPLSSGGASLAEPWLRFHTPLIEPDRRISRIRLPAQPHRCVGVERPIRRVDGAY
jgi:hypothetical protein